MLSERGWAFAMQQEGPPDGKKQNPGRYLAAGVF
jgi:hypothetical protein